MNKIFKQNLLAATAVGFVAAAQAENTVVIVSWGGAYTASHKQASHQPCLNANLGIRLVNDDSS